MEKKTTDIKAETSAIKKDTSYIPSIKQDTSQIAGLIKEIGFLRLQVCDRRLEDSDRGIMLQRFLEESSSYAESAVDPAEFLSTHADDQSFLEEVDEDQQLGLLPPLSTAMSPSLASELVSKGPNINNIVRLRPNSYQRGAPDAKSLGTDPTRITDTSEGNHRYDETDPGVNGRSPAPAATLPSKIPPSVPKRKPLRPGQSLLREDRPEHNAEVAGDSTPSFCSPHLQLSFIATVDHARLLELFISAAGSTHETLSREEAVDLLARTRLPQSTLSRIWTLSDTRNSEQLTFPEFATAMFLCSQSLQGNELPAVLSLQMQSEISNMIDHIFPSRPNTSLSKQIAPTHGYTPALRGERREPVSVDSASNHFTSLLSAGSELKTDYKLSYRLNPTENITSTSPPLSNSDFSNDLAQTQSHSEWSTSSKEGAPRPKPDPSKTRLWTDRTGSFKVEAQLLGRADEKIYLHKLNGVKIAIPKSLMSHDDLAYVEQISGTRSQFTG